MSRLTDRDISELDEWLKAKFIEMARSSLTPGLSSAEREETLGVAMRIAMSMTWMSGQGARIIGTIDGISRLLYQSIKARHPDMTYERTRSFIADPRHMEANIAKVNDAFEELNIGKGKSFERKKKKQRAVRPPRNSR